MLPAARFVGTHDVALITLDSLRYDVAEDARRAGRTPRLAALLPGGAWERRHTPGSFTLAAHAAFFAGFLPTPARPGRHPRPFALRFPGSETTAADTAVFDAPDIVSGFRGAGYHTVCVGGVGFFNKLSPLGSALPALFDESHWAPELGVTCRDSARHQVDVALDRVGAAPAGRRLFLFLNVAATHQPTTIYLPGSTEESPETQAAALADADGHLGRLFGGLRRRGPWLAVVCSDHGTAFGDDGYRGHRLAHPCVWDVPYAEFVLPGGPP